MRRKDGSGYLNERGYIIHGACGEDIREHVLVAEKALGKKLPEGAVVHHRDKNPSNNNPWNLIVFASQADHLHFHKRERAYDASGHADWLKCHYCKQYDDPINLYVYKNSSRMPHHRSCRQAHRRST